MLRTDRRRDAARHLQSAGTLARSPIASAPSRHSARRCSKSIAQQATLAGLTTRESDDYAITILELFAATGDVLTFYNERIANELFLRTARERDSLLRLTRLIGYRLRPGLAAQTMLSFALDPGAETRIRKGLKVMSVPGQDEKPQIFETIEQIVADADLNEAAAFAPPILFNGLALGSTGGPIVARPEKLAVGDKAHHLRPRDVSRRRPSPRSSRAPMATFSRSRPASRRAVGYGDVARAAKLEGRLRFFGHNAPQNVNVYRSPAQPDAVAEMGHSARRCIARRHDGQLSTRWPLHRYRRGNTAACRRGSGHRTATAHGKRRQDR